jgi:cytokinin dehydrogenase
VEAIPNGVFHSTSPIDIAALIWLSISQSKPFTVAPRGQGHSARGQALAPVGIVVDMRSMGRGNHGYHAKVVTPAFPKKTKCIPICMPGSSFMHIVTNK